MSILAFDPFALTAFTTALKATVILGAAGLLLQLCGRRSSAAFRHLVWTVALVSTLALPLVAVVLPAWSIPIEVATALTPAPIADVPDDVAPRTGATVPAPVPALDDRPEPRSPVRQLSWTAAAGTLYLLGALAVLIRVMAHRWIAGRLVRGATVVTDADWIALVGACASRVGVAHPVRLLRSAEGTMPMAVGTRRPAILLPAVADAWDEERRRAVLLHELAHVARHDCLTQLMAALASAAYWFNPAVWYAVQRLRIERELACDDRVIVAGTEPREYAGHLLEIAYSFGRHRAPALAVSMARPRQLETRMLAALDDARNRNVPARRARLAVAVGAAVLLVPLAGGRPAVVEAEAASGAVAVQAASTEPPAQERIREWRAVESSISNRETAELPVIERARRLLRGTAGVLRSLQDNLPGTWEIRPGRSQGTVHLRLTELNSSSGTDVPLDRLEGLTAAQMSSGGPVQFRIRRDAGTFTFEGIFRGGVGAGTFSFTPDPSFAGALEKRGFARPSDREQYQLARHDVGFAFVDELNKQGYAKPATAELVRAGQHGVRTEYLREMGALGYRLGSLEPLIVLRDHGVTPEYVRALAELGYKGLSADEIRRARDHGISPEYVRGMRDAGYGSVPLAQLIDTRDHGVTPEYVRALADAGHRKLPLDQIVRVRDHGVMPDYVREMRQLGYTPSIDDLVRARDHGVDLQFVRGMAGAGLGSVPLDSLIRMRDHGVTPDYVQALKTLGYDGLGVDDLVGLRDHGLTAERIRAANARAGSRLPIDLLRSLAAGGGIR